MATTVHIPPALLRSVERRAWAPEFLDRLRAVDDETREAVDELLETVTRGRRSRRGSS